MGTNRGCSPDDLVCWSLAYLPLTVTQRLPLLGDQREGFGGAEVLEITTAPAAPREQGIRTRESLGLNGSLVRDERERCLAGLLCRRPFAVQGAAGLVRGIDLLGSLPLQPALKLGGVRLGRDVREVVIVLDFLRISDGIFVQRRVTHLSVSRRQLAKAG